MVSGILTALLARASHGRGATRYLCSTRWRNGRALGRARSTAVPPRPLGAHHASIAPHGPVTRKTASGIIAIQNPREWTRLCAEVLDVPSLGHARFDPLRIANRLR
jgi:formyl-CoA transferase